MQSRSKKSPFRVWWPRPTTPYLAVTLLTAFRMCVGGAPVTFNAQIGPIIYANCSSCHRPGEAAPFSLMSFDDVVRKAKTIAKVTSARSMPPWKAEPASYAYRDERRLSDQQISLIQSWVEQGMLEGNDLETPKPPTFNSGWMLGEPDLVVEMPQAFHVPADGPDIYRNIPIQLGQDGERWITAIDMKPSSRGVVHHVLYFADGTGKIHERPHQGSEPGFSGMRLGRKSTPLGGWAVGAQPHFFPEGLAMNLPKGADLVVQYHFHPTGKAEVEKSRIGLYFAKSVPERTLARIQIPPHYSLFSDLNIPAGEKDFVIRDSYILPTDVDGVGVGAHAHYLANKLQLTATFPDGTTKTLLLIKDWDFAWQDRYFFKDLVPLPKGTQLEAEIHWNNSSDNPHNPSNPPIPVSWGEESKDEMGSVSLIAVPHVQSDYPILRDNLAQRDRRVAMEKMKSDPAIAMKVARLLGD